MPAYCRAVRARFRVELLARWREGDEAGAAEWAERAERDAALGPDDELLADAIRAAVRGDALGGSSRTGRWRLPSETPSILSLDANADLSGKRRLA